MGSPKKSKATYKETAPGHKIPASLAKYVGRIIVSWAHLEYITQEAVWIALGVTPEEGRVAVREPRVPERLELIKTLADLKGVTIKKEWLQQLVKTTKAINRHRDLLAHGVWTQDHDKSWKVVRMRGKWPENTTDHHKDKRVAPEALGVTTDGLEKILQEIDKCIDAARNIRRALEQRLNEIDTSP